MKEQIKRILEQHRGRENAIPRKRLRNEIIYLQVHECNGGIVKPLSDRKMRELINELRHTGYPILSATGKPSGYYMPATYAEVKEARRMILSYVIDLRRTLKALRIYGERYVAKE